MLPDGNLMIVGGHNPVHGDTYRFNPRTRLTTKLNSLNNYRGYVGLICHAGYLYAFGGISSNPSKAAERMDIRGNGWNNLPNMIGARARFSLISMNDKIYLIGGGPDKIEYYNPKDNTFSSITAFNIISGCFGTITADSKILLINKSELTILSTDFNMIETKPYANQQEIYSLSNYVKRGKKVYFYSSESGLIYSYDSEDKALTEITTSNFYPT